MSATTVDTQSQVSATAPPPNRGRGSWRRRLDPHSGIRTAEFLATVILFLIALPPRTQASFSCSWRGIDGIPNTTLCQGKTNCEIGTITQDKAIVAYVGLYSNYELGSSAFDYIKPLNDTRWAWGFTSPTRLYNQLNSNSPDGIEPVTIYPSKYPIGPGIAQPRLQYAESTDPTFWWPNGCSSLKLTFTIAAPTTKPKVSLSVDRPIVADGDPTNVTLSWTVSGATSATSCTASGAWSGSKSAANGSEFIAPPTKTSTYTLSCTEAKPASTTVQVFGVPQNLGSVVNRSGDELAVSINRKSPNTMLLLGYRAPGGNGDLFQAIYDPNTDRWSAPSALPAPVNSTGHEHSASNQGNQLVLSGWRTQGATNVDLFQSLWVSNKFTTPTVLSNNVSTSANESYPFIAADGSKLLFASDRPGGAGSYDIYQSTPTASGWGNVTRLGAPISSSASDISPFISKDGSTLFFSSSRNGTFDIYFAKKKRSGWDTPIAFGAPFNTSSAEQSPALTDDGTRLYFVSNRNGGYGGLDLYVSVRK